jgi:hydrogenase-1 operon protein HyaF
MVWRMSRLSEISIRIEAPTRLGGLGGGVGAVLSELVSMLERVAAGGDTDTIDLRSLPMSAEDRTELQSALGQGEVHASLRTEGVSTLQETAVSGVWWIEHRDAQGEVVAELIEVGAIPAILNASPEDMAASARALRSRLVVNQPAAARIPHATLS